MSTAQESQSDLLVHRMTWEAEDVLSVEIYVVSQIERKRCVSSFVFAETRTVNPDGGSGHHAFEVDEYVLASGRGRKLETAAVKRDELV